MSDNTQKTNPERIKMMKRYRINFDGHHYQIGFNQFDSFEKAIDYAKEQSELPSYLMGRFMATVISLVGWIVACVGVIVMATSIKGTLSQYQYVDNTMISIIIAATPGFFTMLGGLFSVMSGQVVRAILDISDDVRRIRSVTLP